MVYILFPSATFIDFILSLQLVLSVVSCGACEFFFFFFFFFCVFFVVVFFSFLQIVSPILVIVENRVHHEYTPI